MKVAAALILVISVVIVSQANAQDENKMKDMIGKFMEGGGNKEDMKKKLEGMMKAFSGIAGKNGGGGTGVQVDMTKVMDNPKVKEILGKILKSEKIQKLKDMIGTMKDGKSKS